MRKSAYIFAALLALTVSAGASAQSKSFNMGKWIEVHNAILKELNRSYVDSLEVGRIQRKAVDAMLESLDPYTVYVPEEEQEASKPPLWLIVLPILAAGAIAVLLVLRYRGRNNGKQS
jgi:hypothetical protein